MKRYESCQRTDGDCTVCSLVSYNRDCHNAPISQLAYLRSAVGLTQQQLADKAGINIRQVQKMERGESNMGNITLKNAIALSKALGVKVEDLL